MSEEKDKVTSEAEELQSSEQEELEATSEEDQLEDDDALDSDEEEEDDATDVEEEEGEEEEDEDEDDATADLPVLPKKQSYEEEGKWYSLRVISGKERKIKERIDLEVKRSGWDSFITQVLVPTEKVYKIRGGKKVISERNILPGYILIEALPSKLSGEIVQSITNIPNVIHFLGRNQPIPMRTAEANRMLGKVDESQDAGESLIEPFIVGETVKIIDGPFSEFVGDIQEVNEEKKKLKVIVKIFGRGTEVELNFMQVEKQA
nr:transcription termination/antitermination protein NusG [Flavilitoribacter nigricans]